MTTLDQLRKIASTLRLTADDCDGRDPEQIQDDSRWDLEQLLPQIIAEIERDAEDVERYRWLRGPDQESTRYSRWKVEYWAGAAGWQPMQREQMDSAIDTAKERT